MLHYNFYASMARIYGIDYAYFYPSISDREFQRCVDSTFIFDSRSMAAHTYIPDNIVRIKGCDTHNFLIFFFRN